MNRPLLRCAPWSTSCLAPPHPHSSAHRQGMARAPTSSRTAGKVRPAGRSAPSLRWVLFWSILTHLGLTCCWLLRYWGACRYLPRPCSTPLPLPHNPTSRCSWVTPWSRLVFPFSPRPRSTTGASGVRESFEGDGACVVYYLPCVIKFLRQSHTAHTRSPGRQCTPALPHSPSPRQRATGLGQQLHSCSSKPQPGRLEGVASSSSTS